MTINRKLLLYAIRTRLARRLFFLLTAWLLAIPLASEGTFNIPPLPKEKRSDSKQELPPPPPKPVPVAVQMDGGGTIQIPLRIYGRQEQATRFLVRKGPALGKIVSLEPLEQEVWLLTYQHTAALNGETSQQDRILFAAQNKNGTSSAVEIVITINDTPPELAVPATVEYGEIATGLPAVRLVTIVNKGGGILEGSATADAPWALESSSYKLRRGEQAQLRLALTPETEREYRGRLHFSGNPPVEIPLHAYAAAPFTAAPAALELTGRSGSLTLTNRTASELTLQVEANPRLHLPTRIVLPAQGTQSVPAALAPEDPAAIEGDIRISFGSVFRQIHVHAEAVPTAEPSPTPAPFPTPSLASTSPIVPQPTVFPSATPASLSTMGPTRPELSQDIDPEALKEVLSKVACKPGDLPFIPRFAPVRITSRTAEFAWSPHKIPNTEGPLGYRIEVRRLYFDPNRKVAQRWIPVPDVQFTLKPDRVTGLIIGIPPDTHETARVVALTPNGEPCAASLPLQFSTPPPLHLLTLRNGALAGFLLLLAAAVVLKRSKKITPDQKVP